MTDQTDDGIPPLPAIFKDTDSEDFKAGVMEGIRRCHGLIQYTIANSDNDHLNEIREDIAYDLLKYAPNFHAQFKSLEEMQKVHIAMTNDAVARAIRLTRKQVLQELQEKSHSLDVIVQTAREELVPVVLCCSGVPAKSCDNDVWKGNIIEFTKKVFTKLLPKE
jgi:hypothetical protein